VSGVLETDLLPQVEESLKVELVVGLKLEGELIEFVTDFLTHSEPQLARLPSIEHASAPLLDDLGGFLDSLLLSLMLASGLLLRTKDARQSIGCLVVENDIAGLDLLVDNGSLLLLHRFEVDRLNALV